MPIITLENEEAVIQSLCENVEKIAKESIEKNGLFRVGLSGGSLIKYLGKGLPEIETDWSKWVLFFCDERYVPESDIDSTYGAYKDLLVPKTGLSEDQFVKINIDIPLECCAINYERLIMDHFKLGSGIPVFDLLLLGMGPDGHTCSLFPTHKLLNEREKLIAPIDDSPKLPPQRITMTYPIINNAKNCIFAMAGKGKAEMIRRIFIEKEQLPAGLVQPTCGDLLWIVDKAAGFYL